MRAAVSQVLEVWDATGGCMYVLAVPNRGNANAKLLLAKPFAARALAAYALA